MSTFLNKSKHNLNLGCSRQQWISESAYFKAEQRKFENGNKLSDWLQAEIEYSSVYIKLFLDLCKEDGGLTVMDLQVLATYLGVEKSEMIKTKTRLIREIQTKSGLNSCFQSGNRQQCKHRCDWNEECRKLIAVFYR